MKEFILGLYANESFPIYLGAIILVLLVAFFVVFFLGKKDQKNIEKTQRLEQIKDDAFKEVSPAVAVSSPVPETSNTLEIQNEIIPSQQPVVTPIVNEVTPIVSPISPVEVEPVVEMQTEVPVINEPEVTPVVELPQTPIIEATAEAPMVLETTSITESPVLSAEPAIDPDTYKSPQSIDKLLNEKPVPKFDPDPVIEPYIPEPDLSSFNNLATSIESELTELEKQQEIAKPIIENTPEVEPVITPVVEPIVSELPQVPDITPIGEPASPIEIKMPEVPVIEPEVKEETQSVLEPIQTDTTNTETVSNPTKVMNVFSSVYAPPKKEETPTFDDTMAIELPKLKDAPVLNEEEGPSIKF